MTGEIVDGPQPVQPAMASNTPTLQKRIRAILLADRIETANLNRDNVVSTAPLTFRCGADGYVTLFRYGVVVLINLSPEEEEAFLITLKPRLTRAVEPREDEVAYVGLAPDKDDQILPGRPFC